METLPFRRCDDRHPGHVESSSPRSLYPGFDTVRAIAALGVVLLHACVPYLRYPMPGLDWLVRDTPSDAIDGLFWTIELFIMPIFLVLAGFLAWQTFRRRGAGSLLRSRASRLLKPLLFGMVVVLPLDLYLWILGWVAEGMVPIVKLKSLKIPEPLGENLWGLSHLWFLQYLFLYVVVLAAWMTARERFAILGRVSASSSVVVMALFVVAMVTLIVRPQVVWGFQHAFTPVPSKWIYSGTFFLGGVWIACRDPHLERLRLHAPRLIAPAILSAVAALMLGRWHLAGGDQAFASVALAALTVGSAWGITLATIGLAVRIGSISRSMQYLAAASFWVYLVHHPILGLIHLDLKWWFPEVAPLMKLLLAFPMAVGVCLLSYEGLVRRSALGQWLGMAWSPSDIAATHPGSQPPRPQELFPLRVGSPEVQDPGTRSTRRAA